MRAIRIRFLLASVIAVSTGLTVQYWRHGTLSLPDAALTYAGVIFLHASVDLLNDFWDHKRGIDQETVRTQFSGGTGVLPDKLLNPRSVYIAGILFLVLGCLIGSYFVYLRGPVIAIILGFAVVAIYFYSTRIVDAGLGEFFVAVKGAMIVLGTFYVQWGSFDVTAAYSGVVIGLLSATVLFSNSFPDYAADKSKGRRTLVIILGRQRSAFLFPVLVGTTYAMIIAGVLLGFAKMPSLACFASAPFALKAARKLIRDQECIKESLVPAMASAVAYSRITGAIFAASFLL